MVKICVVKSCPSGRKMKNKTSGSPESLFYFQLKDKARLESWNTSLGTELKSTDYICHLHFKEDHIKMFEKLYIHDELRLIPLKNKMLKSEALPTIEHQFIPTSWYDVHDLQPSKVHEQQSPNSYHNNSTDEEQCHVEQNSINQQEFLDNQESSNNSLSINEQTEKDLEDPLLTQYAHNSLKNHQETTELTNQPVQTFIDKIRKSSTLPKFWLYVETPNGLEFMKMDQRTKLIKHHIRLNRDLSISVIFPNNEEVLLDDKIKSFNNIHDYLITVGNWPLCGGTQIDDKYSTFCKGMIFGDDAYKRHPQHPRCKYCRMLRSNLKRKMFYLNSITAKRHSSDLVKQCEHVKQRADENCVSSGYNIISNENGHETIIQVEASGPYLSACYLKDYTEKMSHRCAFLCEAADVTHGFPNPKKLPRMFQIWVRILEEQVNITLSKDNYRNLRICSKHFENKFRNRNNRLNALAVPTLHLPRTRLLESATYQRTQLLSVDLKVAQLKRCLHGAYSVAKEATLHRFPNPNRYPKAFEAWVRIIKEIGNITVTRQNWNDVVLCDKHFERKYWNRCKRLNISAVPTLRLYMTDKQCEKNGCKNDSTFPNYRLRSVPIHVVDYEDYIEALTINLENLKRVSTSPDKCEVEWGPLPISQHEGKVQVVAARNPKGFKHAFLNGKLAQNVHNDHPYSKEALDEDTEWRVPRKKRKRAADSVKSQSVEPRAVATEYTDDVYDCYDHIDAFPAPSNPEPSKHDSEKKSGPVFSWEESVELITTDDMDVVGCPTIGDDIGTAQTPVDISLYDDDPIIKPEKHVEYRCNECRKKITGFRYTCVQCPDLDLCDMCEARELHGAHYVLRVPSSRPYNEIQTVLAAIRQQLLSENLFFNNEMTTNIKEEPKEEWDAGVGEAEPDHDPLEDWTRNLEELQTDRSEVIDTGLPHRKIRKLPKTDDNLPRIRRTKVSTFPKYAETRPKPTKIDEKATISENTPKKTPQTLPPPKLQVITKYGKVHTKLKPISPEKVPEELKVIDKVLSRFKRKSNNPTLLRLRPGSDPMVVARALKTKVVVHLKPLSKEEIERYQKRNKVL